MSKLDKIEKKVLPALKAKRQHQKAFIGKSQPTVADRDFFEAVDELEAILAGTDAPDEVTPEAIAQQVLESEFEGPFEKSHSGGGIYDILDANGQTVIDNYGKKEAADELVALLNGTADDDGQ